MTQSVRTEDYLLVAKKVLTIENADIRHCLAFDSVTDRADAVTPGTVFFARRGSAHDGHNFIAKALQQGAALIVAEHATPDLAKAPAYIQSKDCARLYNLASAMIAGMPQDHLQFVGITGTNGKTSTAHILGQLLAAQGISCMVVGTIGAFVNGEKIGDLSHTTPDAKTFFSLLNKALAKGVRWIVMEASSHGLDQARFFPVKFDIAIFTSFSQDHLDYHKSMEHYLTAKLQIFSDYFAKPQAKFFVAKQLFSLLEENKPDIIKKLTFYSLTKPNSIPSTLIAALPFQADFLQENCLAALLAAKSISGAWPSEVVVAGLHQVPGRMQEIRLEATTKKNTPQVFVDYGHSPDALEKALHCLAKLKSTDSRLIVVFGCGGNRDTGKRPLMGEVAEKLADLVIITNDNPRQEAPETIATAILSGMRFPEKAQVELARRQAIRRAIKEATGDDLVLIAGKGHETYQIIGDKTSTFDDAEESRSALIEKQDE